MEDLADLEIDGIDAPPNFTMDDGDFLTTEDDEYECFVSVDNPLTELIEGKCSPSCRRRFCCSW